jgi:histidyl-tRNA synthetase
LDAIDRHFAVERRPATTVFSRSKKTRKAMNADGKEPKKTRIQPRILSGFRDFLPEAMIPRERMMDNAKRVYRSYGFAPIDTPTLEYIDILLGKGGNESDKQMYRFTDNGGRDVGMRFDLTIPLARFVAQHANDLGLPFKRYHIGCVWRAEKPQFGRYREFMQCDFDSIGSRHVASDIETALVIHDLLQSQGFERFTIRLNSRQILNGILDTVGLLDQSATVLRSLDKLAKVGRTVVVNELQDKAGASSAQVDQILELADLKGTNQQILNDLKPMVSGNDTGEAGLARLHAIVDGFEAAGANAARLRIDASIARGLDYYTGAVFETILDDLPSIGSVCSGGRYDDLAAVYTKQELPGIGASLGLDRLLTAQEKLGMIPKVHTPAQILIPYFDETGLPQYLKLAGQLRREGFRVEVFPEPKKLGQQLKYADRRGFIVAIIQGRDELEQGVCQVKDLRSGEQKEVVTDDIQILVRHLNDLLNDRNPPAV